MLTYGLTLDRGIYGYVVRTALCGQIRIGYGINGSREGNGDYTITLGCGRARGSIQPGADVFRFKSLTVDLKLRYVIILDNDRRALVKACRITVARHVGGRAVFIISNCDSVLCPDLMISIKLRAVHRIGKADSRL